MTCRHRSNELTFSEQVTRYWGKRRPNKQQGHMNDLNLVDVSLCKPKMVLHELSLVDTQKRFGV